MRVLYLTHRLPFTANRGDRIRALHTLQVLSRHADVDVVSLVHSREEEAHARDLHDIASSVSVARTSRLRGYGRALVGLAGSRPFTHAFLDAPGVAVACRRLMAESPPDVVLALCSGMARFALAAPLSDVPLVIDLVSYFATVLQE